MGTERATSSSRPKSGSKAAPPQRSPTFGRVALFVSGALCYAMSLATPMSLTVMFLHWQAAFEVSRARTAAVLATCVGILFAGGIVTGYISTRFGARTTSLVGTFLGSAGFFLSSCAFSIDFLIITTGLVSGFGFCLLQICCVPSLTSPFANRHRSLVLSGAGIINGLANVGMPYLVDALIQHYSWRGTFIILAGFTLNAAVLVLVMTSFLPAQWPKSSALFVAHWDHPEVDNSVDHQPVNLDQDALLDAEMTTSLTKQSDGNMNKNLNKPDDRDQQSLVQEPRIQDMHPEPTSGNSNISKQEKHAVSNDLSPQQYGSSRCDPTNSASPTTKNQMVPATNEAFLNQAYPEYVRPDDENCELRLSGNPPAHKVTSPYVTGTPNICAKVQASKWSFLVDPVGIVYNLNVALSLGTCFSFFTLLIDFARTAIEGGGEREGLRFITTVMISTLVSRPLVGPINMLPHCHSVVIMAFSCLVTGSAMLVLGSVTHFYTAIGVLVVMGLGFGVLLTVFLKVPYDLKGVTVESYPLALGVASTTEGIVDLIVPILIGVAVDATNSYFLPLTTMGVLSILLSVLLIVTWLMQERRMRKTHELVT